MYYSDGFVHKKVGGVESKGYNPSEAASGLAQGPGSQATTVAGLSDWLGSNVGRLDYIFADFENDSHVSSGEAVRDRNTRLMVMQVRADANADVSNARIGNYGDFPGRVDLSEIAPGRIDRTRWWGLQHLGLQSDRHEFYLSSGLDVAMPNLYPYGYYVAHSLPDAASWGWTNYPSAGRSFVAPNYRSALFWAPLERLSVAARDLPAGHELIPWVTDYLPGNLTLPADQIPTLADNEASIRHYRLRGADGYYTFVIRMDNTTYRSAVNAAWHSLDRHFELPGARRVLNLATNKTNGFEWSALQKGHRVLALLSNLNTMSQVLNWTNTLQLPARSPTVLAGSHEVFKYRSSYFNNDNMESYVAGQSMNDQGAASWQGPTPGSFSAAAPPGSGNRSSRSVSSGAADAASSAWYRAANPGFVATDKVVYSAWMFSGGTSVGFLPATAASGTPTALPLANHHGPLLRMHNSRFKIRRSMDNGTLYQAVNVVPVASKWYEVRVAIDPMKDLDGVTGGDHGAASVWVRNVTDGQADFSRLVFDDPATVAVAERFWEVPLQLNASGLRDISNFDAWIVSAHGTDNAIDNLNAGYYVPQMDDNFDHYDPTAANGVDFPGWSSGQTSFRVRTSVGAGNGASLALTPVSDESEVVGRWRTEPAGFQPGDAVIYQGRLNGGEFSGVAAPVGFAPATDSADESGPYVSIHWGELQIRPTRSHGPIYTATNRSVSASTWYEVRMVVEPTRDIDGSSGDCYGVATVFIRDLAAGETGFTQLAFDDSSTVGSAEALTEIPLWLNSNSNPTTFAGWEVSGSPATQIDALSATLRPN